MGLPNINITFKSQAVSAVARSEKGVVALIVRDSKQNGPLVMTNAAQVPTALGKVNQEYISRAFTGYVNPPRKVLCYVLAADAANLGEALEWLATERFDYLAGPPDVTEAECAAIADWVKARRADDHAVCKAVLPGCEADSEAVVNFVAEGIQAGGETYTAAQYASRIAGLIAGTPMTISCTYAPLAEVTDVARLTQEELDAAVDAGKFILFHDGEKVKVGRGVNSLVTTSEGRGDAFKKIKIVEAMDMIQNDIRMTADDSYIGKYPNSYDNKCLLIMAIKGYLEELERSGVLAVGSSVIELDLEAQENYLKSKGIDTGEMSEQQIKEANTDAKVFLRASVSILDAIEDITIVNYL